MEKFDFTVFKRSISLSHYAAAQGYELDKKKSTRSSTVMRHANGDKIIISKKAGSWVYFSVFDENDNGTIIDFIRKRTGKTFPEIGQQLKAWAGIDYVLPVHDFPDTTEQVYDRSRIAKAFGWMKPAGSHPYLINERKIPAVVLSHPRFARRIFRDRYGNVVFPQWDGQGICGLELKNHDKGIFMRGSEKSLWISRINPTDTALTLAEAPIDALSHFTLCNPTDTAYGAVSGGMRGKQFEFLLHVITNMPLLTKIVLAVDNDAGGDKIASRIESFLKGKFTGEIIRHSPPQKGMDWNKVLQAETS